MSIFFIFGTFLVFILTGFLLFKERYIIGASCFLIFFGSMFLVHKKKKHEELIILISTDYKPYSYIVNGKISGIDLELLRYIANTMHKKLVIKTVSFSLLFKNLENTKVQVVAGGLSINNEREKKFFFSSPYIPATCGIITRHNDYLINEHFNGKIGVQSNSIYLSIIKNKFPKAKIIEIEDFSLIIEKYKNKKIDAVIADTIVLIDNFGLNNKDYSIKKIHVPSNLSKGIAFLVDPKIIDEFNLALIKATKKQRKLNHLLEEIEKIEEF